MRIIVRKITPARRELLNPSALRSELQDAMDELKDGVERDFESTVSSWNTPVSFAVRVTAGNAITLQVTPAGQGATVWGYLNEGTSGHYVYPRGRALRFQGNYRSKTRPGRLSSGAGGGSGNYVYSKGHYVSGIEPREWTSVIAEKWTPEFRRIGENAMRRVARQ